MLTYCRLADRFAAARMRDLVAFVLGIVLCAVSVQCQLLNGEWYMVCMNRHLNLFRSIILRSVPKNLEFTRKILRYAVKNSHSKLQDH